MNFYWYSLLLSYCESNRSIMIRTVRPLSLLGLRFLNNTTCGFLMSLWSNAELAVVADSSERQLYTSPLPDFNFRSGYRCFVCWKSVVSNKQDDKEIEDKLKFYKHYFANSYFIAHKIVNENGQKSCFYNRNWNRNTPNTWYIEIEILQTIEIEIELATHFSYCNWNTFQNWNNTDRPSL